MQIFCLLVCWAQQVLEEEPCEGTLRLQWTGGHGRLHLQWEQEQWQTPSKGRTWTGCRCNAWKSLTSCSSFLTPFVHCRHTSRQMLVSKALVLWAWASLLTSPSMSRWRWCSLCLFPPVILFVQDCRKAFLDCNRHLIMRVLLKSILVADYVLCHGCFILCWWRVVVRLTECWGPSLWANIIAPVLADHPCMIV